MMWTGLLLSVYCAVSGLCWLGYHEHKRRHPELYAITGPMPILKWWFVLAWPLFPVTVLVSDVYWGFRRRLHLRRMNHLFVRMGFNETRAAELTARIDETLREEWDHED